MLCCVVLAVCIPVAPPRWLVRIAGVARGIVTLCQSKSALLVALIGLTPFGEALLSTGLYMVALKQLTTAETRRCAATLDILEPASAVLDGACIDYSVTTSV